MNVKNSALIILIALATLGCAATSVHAERGGAMRNRRTEHAAAVRADRGVRARRRSANAHPSRHDQLLAKLHEEDVLLYQLRHERNAYAHKIAHLAALVRKRRSEHLSGHDQRLAAMHAKALAARRAKESRVERERRMADEHAHGRSEPRRQVAEHAAAESQVHREHLAALDHLAQQQHRQRLAQIRAHLANVHAARLRHLENVEAEREKRTDNSSRAVHIATRSGLPIWQGDAYAAQVPVKIVTVDLNDPRIRVSALLARNGIGTSEPFTHMIDRTHPYVAVTGTFFSLDNLRPVGDIVINGSLAYFGGMGTALAIKPDNHADMITVPWGHHHNWTGYQTVVACGPRLLLNGQIVLDPRLEHFRDQHMLAPNSRIAVGITGHNQLVFCMTRDPIYLGRLAKVMRSLGCEQAMNLDAGTSTGFYCDGRLMARPGRRLTNAIVVYDNVRSRIGTSEQSASAAAPESHFESHYQTPRRAQAEVHLAARLTAH